MTLYAFLQKYGTHTTSIMLRNLAQALHDTRDAHGHDVTMPYVEEMAKGLEDALTHFHNSNKPADF